MTDEFNGKAPAFPLPLVYNNREERIVDTEEYCGHNLGMTLWDYFASHAPNGTYNARTCADFADDMLKEREKRFKKHD